MSCGELLLALLLVSPATAGVLAGFAVGGLAGSLATVWHLGKPVREYRDALQEHYEALERAGR